MMSPLFSQSKLRGRLVQYNGEFMTLVVYKNWLCCFAFRPKPGSVAPFVAASSLAPMTTYLFVFFHRSPPLYTWSQDFFGINLQSYIWCLCKFVLLSYKQSFLWHIRIITEHTYWKRTSCSPLLPSWANERLCALGAGAQLFKLSNPVDRQTREKGPNCDSSPPLH